MTKQEKTNYLNMQSIAYFSGFSGLEIKAIEYGINDRIIFTVGAWNGKPEIHSSKVYYTVQGNSYFKFNGYRVPLDECIRM